MGTGWRVEPAVGEAAWQLTLEGSPVTGKLRFEKRGTDHLARLALLAGAGAPNATTMASLLATAESVARVHGRASLQGDERVVLRVETGRMTPESTESLAALGFGLTVAEDEFELQLGEGHSPPALPDGLAFRPWSESTVQEFFRVYSDAFRDRPGFPGWDEFTWTGIYTGSPEFAPELSLLLLEHGRPVAFCVSTIEGDTGWLEQLGVIPAERRRGLAQLLIAAVVAEMRRAGLAKARLSVATNNPGAAALYRVLGFRESGRYEVYAKTLVLE